MFNDCGSFQLSDKASGARKQNKKQQRLITTYTRASIKQNDQQEHKRIKKASGACDGFAKEEKGKWSVDGNSVPGIKLKPVKKNADGSAAAPEVIYYDTS